MIVIRSVRRKLLVPILACILAAAGGIVVALPVLKLPVAVRVAGGAATLLAAGGVVLMLKKMTGPETSLVIDRKSIIDTSVTPEFRIPWGEITRVGIIESRRSLGIEVQEPEAVLARLGAAALLRKADPASGFHLEIPGGLLEKSTEKLLSKIENYLHSSSARKELRSYDKG